MLIVKVIVNSAHRQCLFLLKKGQTLKVLALILILTEQVKRLKEGLKQALLCSSCTDDVGTYAVDRSIEVVQTDVCAVELTCTHELSKQVTGVVIKACHMVRIPVHRS